MCHRFDLHTTEKKEIKLVNNIKLPLLEDSLVELNKKAFYLSLDNTNALQIKEAVFGLDAFDKKIYNARIETILEKNIFKEDYILHKGVFPCSLFYESDENGNEHKFIILGKNICYLAGFIINNSFILITRSATPDLNIFKRMPVVLTSYEVETFLKSQDNIKIIDSFNNVKYHIENFNPQITLF